MLYRHRGLQSLVALFSDNRNVDLPGFALATSSLYEARAQLQFCNLQEVK